MHCDGARIWNASIALGVAALVADCDTVMFCLSKGLGAPVGSLLCGSAAVIAEAREHRQRFGGSMRQAGIIAAAGIVALETMVERLADDHARARRLADAIAERFPGAVDPAAVRTNIVCCPIRTLPDQTLERLGHAGIMAGTLDPSTFRFVVHKDVDDDGKSIARALPARSAIAAANLIHRFRQEAPMSRALVTGCSTGIGRAAVELTKRGFEVVATARRPETLADLDVAATLALDVDSDDSVAAAVAAAGPIDVLVNNAGFGVIGPVESVPLAEVRRMFETNVFGVIRMIQAVLPQMRERGSGTIVNVTSLAGRVAPPFDGFYSATKFGVEGLSEALHYEVGHFGIRIVLIEPGVFETAFGDNAARFGMEGGPTTSSPRSGRRRAASCLPTTRRPVPRRSPPRSPTRSRPRSTSSAIPSAPTPNSSRPCAPNSTTPPSNPRCARPSASPGSGPGIIEAKSALVRGRGDRFRQSVDRRRTSGELVGSEQLDETTIGLREHNRKVAVVRCSHAVGLVVAVVGVERHGHRGAACLPFGSLTYEAVRDVAQRAMRAPESRRRSRRARPAPTRPRCTRRRAVGSSVVPSASRLCTLESSRRPAPFVRWEGVEGIRSRSELRGRDAAERGRRGRLRIRERQRRKRYRARTEPVPPLGRDAAMNDRRPCPPTGAPFLPFSSIFSRETTR